MGISTATDMELQAKKLGETGSNSNKILSFLIFLNEEAININECKS